MKDEARLDKWLWAARIFKTRTIAAAACKKGQVSMKGAQLKPSRTIRVGDIIDVRKPPITYSFRVLQTIEKRVGAKLLVLDEVLDAVAMKMLDDEELAEFLKNSPRDHFSLSYLLEHCLAHYFVFSNFSCVVTFLFKGFKNINFILYRHFIKTSLSTIHSIAQPYT